MPANPKYLTKSPWTRLSRILAGTLGGYTAMISFHLLLAKLFPAAKVVATAFFTGYLMWAVLLLIAFITPKPWQVWLAYAGLTLLCSLPYLIS
ncbi:hypothetical protein INP83_11955 [Mucilaginibacter sp. 21P]|uniref:hypothetical protein n=1 Tax=Mucilaginibacter sp. 21P TaxID=2778902 RepID=UPI001C56DD46|nr:hypothetical protein [Mucilaginibacter sp. 21P]QXV63820.1 hypothetical protein INP83_11955 [Mucilaginibacter sp. 21P]